MKKTGKFLLGLAAVGAAAGAIFAYLNKSKYMEDWEEDDYDFDSGNFHLDPDLQSTDQREYVPLTPKKDVEDAVDAVADKAEDAADAVADKVADAADAAEDMADTMADAVSDKVEDLADIVKDSVD